MTADGYTPAAEMVDELAADEVEEQLHLHYIAFDSLADESDLRRLQVPTLRNCQILIQRSPL